MNAIDKIMEEPATLQEIKDKLHTINTLLPNSEGKVKQLRLNERAQLELQLAQFENISVENEIVVNIEEPTRTFERDTYDIRDIEIVAVKPPRTANEILDERKRSQSWDSAETDNQY